MEPIKFNEANAKLKTPDKAEPIPSFYDNELGAHVTCWKLDERELREVIKNGYIYLTLITGEGSHPVTKITTEKPLKQDNQNGQEKEEGSSE